MSALEIFTVACIAWLVCGGIVTLKTWEPEQGGWVWIVLLWPLQLAARL